MNSIRENIGQAGPIERVANGEPATVVLCRGESANPIAATRALARRHLPLRDAKAAAERAFDGETVVVTLPAVEDLATLERELVEAGFRMDSGEVSPERAAEILGIALPLLHQRMETGKLPFRQVGDRRLIRAVDVAEIKPVEDRRRAAASALSADTEELEDPKYKVLRELAQMDYVDYQVEPKL